MVPSVDFMREQSYSRTEKEDSNEFVSLVLQFVRGNLVFRGYLVLPRKSQAWQLLMKSQSFVVPSFKSAL